MYVFTYAITVENFNIYYAKKSKRKTRQKKKSYKGTKLFYFYQALSAAISWISCVICHQLHSHCHLSHTEIQPFICPCKKAHKTVVRRGLLPHMPSLVRCHAKQTGTQTIWTGTTNIVIQRLKQAESIKFAKAAKTKLSSGKISLICFLDLVFLTI